MKTATLSTRLNMDEVSQLDELSKHSGMDRANLLKILIRKGLRDMQLDMAVQAYSENRITLSKAAEMAGISVRDFLSLMPAKNLILHYDVEELEEDLKAFRM